MNHRVNTERIASLLGKSFFLSTILIAIVINALFVIPSLDEMHDFGSFIAAGQLANKGKNPYAADSPLIFSVYFPKINHYGLAPNLNPPISVLFFEGLVHFPTMQVLAVWRIISVLFFLSAVFFLIQNTLMPLAPNFAERILLVFALAGFWHAIQLGQIYTFMLLVTTGAWIWLKQNRYIWGGIALGILIAVKPNFVFWGLALAAAKNWKAFFSTVLTAISLSVLPILFYGPQIYIWWLEASTIFTPDLLIFPGNNSLQGLTARFGYPQLGIMLGIIFAALILILIHKRKFSLTKVNSLGILISLLISPIAWTGYTLSALPILLERRTWNWRFWLAALIFVVPFYVPLVLFQASPFNFIFFGWFYGWGLLILLGETMSEHTETMNR